MLESTDPTGSKSLSRQLSTIGEHPATIKILALFGAAAIAAWVYIGRSGHTAGVPVPAIELKLRTFLEQVMYARPQTKEFIIGHPAFLLATMALYRPAMVARGSAQFGGSGYDWPGIAGRNVCPPANTNIYVFHARLGWIGARHPFGVSGSCRAMPGLMSTLVSKRNLQKKRVEI